ncbi:hypothetical protein L6164_035984 [Bauhinia variegata]|uniref:Uncharacterized protein n=1 Tax=Bauhinia variegata TaxID=167791 RepID=A0ACB9KFQ4_BAUVA|nr:hypothetical protein L6164_035984 [Bauhinia variegata]
MLMFGPKTVIVALFTISAMASLAAQVHHVVGGDRGWDPDSDLSSWSNQRLFRVGDEIWFTYSAARGLIAELKSREEYEACDVSNPIGMYTDGLHRVPLEREGIRYFVSSDLENCYSGLKLHVEVQPTAMPNYSASSKTLVADGPSSPSGSARCGVGYVPTFMAMFWVAIGLIY